MPAPPHRRSPPAADLEAASPLEELLLIDARPGYPMCFYVETALEGDLDPARLRKAVAALGLRHPRICQRVCRRHGSWWWLPSDVAAAVAVFALAARPLPQGDQLFAPIDLEAESGVRIVAVERAPRQWRVVIQVHHAVCDGVAALEMLGDLWTIYHGNEPPAFRHGRPIRDRGAAPAAAPAPARPIWRQVVDFLTVTPATLAPRSLAQPGPGDGFNLPYATVTLPASLMLEARQAATACGATLNDVVVAAAARSLIAWNRAAGRHADRRLVRINMPTNLRLPGSREPAGNRMAYAFLDRFPDECVDPPALVASLASASRWIQSTRAAEGFLAGLATVRRLPGLLWLMTRLPLCLSTAVVSNLGNTSNRMRADVPRVDGHDCPDGLRLTALAGVPPLRPKTRAAIGVTTYAATTAISVITDTAVIGPGAAAWLAAAIREEIVAFAGGKRGG